ncbi:DUF4374 domain-containing protein [Fodinibius halophilus]|uniref:DUF4374 domain-containing protein n=1 Tax=Fodinibius halophilus TaxID=1736908 RepID=A0A6M1T3A8_9BACT|nr:DUF4374 domain-containing protein [Fodinibius halophilus]NGP87705.1 DUF4374 domain-containing protein [Fodinibius halophilus]
MKLSTLILNLSLAIFLVAGCNDSPVDNDKNKSGDHSETITKFIVTAKPTALENAADYLLTADSLTSGTVSTLNNGTEQDGTYRYYTTDQEQTKFFSFLYGNNGEVATYTLNNNGDLEKIASFQSDRVHAFAPVNKDILSMHIPGISQQNDPTARWYRINTETVQKVDEGEINTKELAGNGEWAFFSWIKQVDDKVFAPYYSISAAGQNVFSTQYPDSAWIAVFSYPEMELQKIIKDDRTSFIGRYYTDGLSVDESGDVYAFSYSVANDDEHQFISTKPTAVTRIKDGKLSFDQDYFFNIEEASGGYHMTNHIYASDGFAVLLMTKEQNGRYDEGKRLAVVNLYDKTFRWVSGFPEASNIFKIMERNYLVSEDGSTAHIGITLKKEGEKGEGSSFIYNIDVANASATRGLKVEGGRITAIHKLENSSN